MLRPHRRAEVGFDFLREIGQHGLNSRTYLAHDFQLSANIVIKEIAKATLNSTRFFAEAQALYVSSHPNVVQIHYACEDIDNVYVAMPLYANGSLKDQMANQAMTVREIVTVGCQVLAGLQHVHSKNLIHLDVKPDNVLLSERGEGLLSDFGLARPVGPDGLADFDEMYVRTQPPEAFRDYEASRAFDIYQVGMLLYRMCCGNDEFDRQFARFVAGNNFLRDAFRKAVEGGLFPDRNCFPAHIPERMRSVVKKCLQVDPNDRFTSALEVANALAQIDGATLDWRYSKPTGGQRWEKNVEGMFYEFEFLDSGGTSCYKTKNGGQRRRLAEGCTEAMTERQVRTFLGEH